MPKRGKIPIEGLLEGYEAALTEIGYSITTKLLLVRRAELMIRRHQNAGLAYFDQAIINCYTGEIDDRYLMAICKRRITNGASAKLTASSVMSTPGEVTRCPVRFVEQGSG